MAWVAFDRAARAPSTDQRLRDRWKKIAAQIHADICTQGVDGVRGCFVQAYGSTRMDASLLLLPVVGFLPPADKRIRTTLRQIEKHLLVDGLLQRYETASGVDGLPPGPPQPSRWAHDGRPLQEITMDEEVFNISIRKFLKMVGVSSQREIEQAVARALQDGSISGGESFPATMTLEMPALKLRVEFDGEVKLQ